MKQGSVSADWHMFAGTARVFLAEAACLTHGIDYSGVPHAKVWAIRLWHLYFSRHSDVGFMAALGLNIHQLGDVSLLDLAPTFLSLLGKPVPAHVSGRVIRSMIEE